MSRILRIVLTERDAAAAPRVLKAFKVQSTDGTDSISRKLDDFESLQSSDGDSVTSANVASHAHAFSSGSAS